MSSSVQQMYFQFQDLFDYFHILLNFSDKLQK